MKRLIILFLVLVLAGGICGCGIGKENETKQDYNALLDTYLKLMLEGGGSNAANAYSYLSNKINSGEIITDEIVNNSREINMGNKSIDKDKNIVPAVEEKSKSEYEKATLDYCGKQFPGSDSISVISIDTGKEYDTIVKAKVSVSFLGNYDYYIIKLDKAEGYVKGHELD
jgi:hypothetical protein|nr:hypothetical protein [uncultured Lachnoclostridium sp.]